MILKAAASDFEPPTTASNFEPPAVASTLELATMPTSFEAATASASDHDHNGHNVEILLGGIDLNGSDVAQNPV